MPICGVSTATRLAPLEFTASTIGDKHTDPLTRYERPRACAQKAAGDRDGERDGHAARHADEAPAQGTLTVYNLSARGQIRRSLANAVVEKVECVEHVGVSCKFQYTVADSTVEDVALLKQVDGGVSQAVPRSLEPLLQLVSLEESVSSPAAARESVKKEAREQ